MPFDAHGRIISGVLSPERRVPADIVRPPYVGLEAPPPYLGDNTYSEEEIGRIRAAGRIASRALDAVGEAIRPGITTDELDRIAHDYVIAHGAYPSTLGYRGYPKSCCTSVNEVICHGIPDDTVLRGGDIVNVDITAYKDGFHGDLNLTFRVGEISEEAELLVQRTEEALRRGIKAVAPGRRVNVIGRVIETYAKRFGYGVVRDFTGHGVGSSFHTGLIIPHYDSAPRFDDLMVPGMVFTIEPMLTLGTHEWDMWSDGWTAVTRDRRLTAQFEHTIVVREGGAEILTLSE
ncbi:MAG: type I methionyl aminopeptidase [Candidatus Leucobacter sulfamidivorax]|nr:type I methionyl aminopeptidase [Candidatus Leucobacter sulfamidivorax]